MGVSIDSHHCFCQGSTPAPASAAAVPSEQLSPIATAVTSASAPVASELSIAAEIAAETDLASVLEEALDPKDL